MTAMNSSVRLAGLDLARFIAFVGMVVVNFKIVMGAVDDGSALSLVTKALEGRAAATFVVLAGIGMGLSALRNGRADTVSVTLKRAAFLLVIGLLNSLVFDADILHYYAFFFLFGVFLLPIRSRWLVSGIVFLNIAFIVMVLVFDFDAGWNWDDYTYTGFWTLAGFLRNLFFNGWHPVVPWLGFLLLGIVLSRMALSQRPTQNRLILYGAAAYLVAELASKYLTGAFSGIDPELGIFATTEPVPPMPLFMLAGSGAASAVIGLCLRSSSWFERIGILGFVIRAGRQTLTLYVAHILIGMGTLEALGMLGGQSLSAAVVASLLFCLFAISYAAIWSKFFKRGPIEAAMRGITG
jgi:uncharacterized membrane protein YeiB